MRELELDRELELELENWNWRIGIAVKRKKNSPILAVGTGPSIATSITENAGWELLQYRSSLYFSLFLSL